MFLQENHVHNKKTANTFDRDWGSTSFWSYGISNQQCGVGILFNTKLKYKVISYHHDVIGRYVIVNFSLDDQIFSLINIYAPTDIKERRDFFNSLDHLLVGRKNFILAGDFNCIEDLHLDKDGGNPKSGNKGVEILKNLCTTFNLMDVFRRKYPKHQDLTYISASN